MFVVCRCFSYVGGCLFVVVLLWFVSYCWLNIVVLMFVCRAMCVFFVAWFVMFDVRCASFVGCSLLVFVD